MNSSNKILLFKILPKSLISRWFGYLCLIPLPRFLLTGCINWYSAHYGVNREEIDYPEKGFRNFNSFFIRRLKPGVHRIDPDTKSIVSPVDARVDQYGKIEHTSILQAKGVDYSLSDLIPSPRYEQFIGGDFITLYLSPADYHRIHTPVNGEVAGFFYLPGKLHTVQEFMVQGLKGLFSLNERLITYVNTERGPVAVCKIGAMNVGRISAVYDPVETNKTFRKRLEKLFPEGKRRIIAKGDELARFNLGSTVILLFPKDTIRFEKMSLGIKVRVGERIASWR